MFFIVVYLVASFQIGGLSKVRIKQFLDRAASFVVLRFKASRNNTESLYKLKNKLEKGIKRKLT
jgi:hypothetical protein